VPPRQQPFQPPLLFDAGPVTESRAGQTPARGGVVAADDALTTLLLERWWAKVVCDPRPGGCWYWIGAIADDGYGRFQAGVGVRSPTVAAHTWGWRAHHGPVPPGLNLLHSCDECSCVHYLDHIAPGSQAENLHQMVRRGRSLRRRRSTLDTRGPAGRSRAIAAALRGGWDEAAFVAALAAGDPQRNQLELPLLLSGHDQTGPSSHRLRSGASDSGVGATG
jgi:hypothetical protein